MNRDGNPRILPPVPPPVVDPGPSSLAEQLASVVNAGAAIEVAAGMRPYRVFSVRERWSGSDAGRGDIVRVRELELLPRPNVELKIKRELRDGGVVERGVAVLTGINPQMTEDQVADLFHKTLKPGETGFIEITMDARDGLSERRPFTVEDMPVRRPAQFDWKVTLIELSKGRTRTGGVTYPGKL